MSDLYWLTEAQMERLKPFFPKSHGKPRVDDRRVLSGIIFINRNGLRWCDALKEYGPAKTLDLPPGRPSFITRVLWVDSGRFRVGQARRARSPQIAQAPGALLPGFDCPARNEA
ncbi:transposase IS5 [Rhodobacter capsulatus B6]|nr:transposase IS5 [Rhodobacter capsulatus B6]